MSIALEYAPWLELATVLTIASVIVVGGTLLAERLPASASDRRTLWRGALVALGLLLVVELSGLGRIAAE